MTFQLYKHKENPQVTKAWNYILKGNREKAIEIIAEEGWTDAAYQVQKIEGFIKFMKAKREAR